MVTVFGSDFFAIYLAARHINWTSFPALWSDHETRQKLDRLVSVGSIISARRSVPTQGLGRFAMSSLNDKLVNADPPTILAPLVSVNVGNFAAAACPILVGELFQFTENWNLILLMFAGVFLLGAICWLFVDPQRSNR